jgi:chaperonin GroES
MGYSGSTLSLRPEPNPMSGVEGLTTEDLMIIYLRNLTEGRSVSMKVKPLHDRLIIKTLEEEEKTKGGIIIPDTAKEKPVEGKVIAVGAGRIKKDGTKMPLEIKKGDRVLYAKYGGTEIKMDGEEYLMMKEDDILAVIE